MNQITKTLLLTALAAGLSSQAAARMAARRHASFATACRHEWMFWDAAYRLEAWPG